VTHKTKVCGTRVKEDEPLARTSFYWHKSLRSRFPKTSEVFEHGIASCSLSVDLPARLRDF
jgi:hypothetical protein